MMRKTLMRASEASPRQIETGGIFGWLLGGKSVLQGKAFDLCLIEFTDVARPFLLLRTYLYIVFHALDAFQINVSVFIGRIIV